MKTLILYKTRYGATEEYARYLNSRIPYSIISAIDNFDTSLINNFDIIIIGSATYAGQIIGKDFLEKNWGVLRNKEIFFFSVGVLKPDSEESKKSYESIPSEIREKIHYLKVPGRISEERLSFIEKMIIKMVGNNLNFKIELEKVEPIVDLVKEKN